MKIIKEWKQFTCDAQRDKKPDVGSIMFECILHTNKETESVIDNETLQIQQEKKACEILTPIETYLKDNYHLTIQDIKSKSCIIVKLDPGWKPEKRCQFANQLLIDIAGMNYSNIIGTIFYRAACAS